MSFIINKYYTRLLSLWKVIEDESTWLLLTFLQGLHVDNPCEHQGMCSQAHYAMYNTCNQQCTCSIFLTSRHYTRCQLLRGWQPFLAACACWESTGRRAKDAFCPHQNGNTGAQYKGKAALCLCVTSKQVCWSGSPVKMCCRCSSVTDSFVWRHHAPAVSPQQHDPLSSQLTQVNAPERAICYVFKWPSWPLNSSLFFFFSIVCNKS